MRADGVADDIATVPVFAVVPDLGGVALQTGSSWTVRPLLVAAVTAGSLCNWHDSVEYFR